jgi:hypothetical protein
MRSKILIEIYTALLGIIGQCFKLEMARHDLAVDARAGVV